MLVEDAEGRFDVCNEGWCLSSLEGCNEPGSALVLSKVVKRWGLCKAIGSLPLALVCTVGCTPKVDGMAANDDEVISVKNVGLRWYDIVNGSTLLHKLCRAERLGRHCKELWAAKCDMK